MSYTDELQAIMSKYPEIQEIKVVLPSELVIKPKVVELVPSKATQTSIPTANLPPEVAAIVNLKPPKIDDGFEIAETIYTENVPKKPQTQKKIQDNSALAATMAALNKPLI